MHFAVLFFLLTLVILLVHARVGGASEGIASLCGDAKLIYHEDKFNPDLKGKCG